MPMQGVGNDPVKRVGARGSNNGVDSRAGTTTSARRTDAHAPRTRPGVLAREYLNTARGICRSLRVRVTTQKTSHVSIATYASSDLSENVSPFLTVMLRKVFSTCAMALSDLHELVLRLPARSRRCAHPSPPLQVLLALGLAVEHLVHALLLLGCGV